MSSSRPAASSCLPAPASVWPRFPESCWRTGMHIEIEGHTDSIGGDDYNMTLSQHRAEAVRDYLVQQGIPNGTIVARGLGKAGPVATNDTPEGRQQNRRVELVLSGEAIGGVDTAAASQPK